MNTVSTTIRTRHRRLNCGHIICFFKLQIRCALGGRKIILKQLFINDWALWALHEDVFIDQRASAFKLTLGHRNRRRHSCERTVQSWKSTYLIILPPRRVDLSVSNFCRTYVKLELSESEKTHRLPKNWRSLEQPTFKNDDHSRFKR